MITFTHGATVLTLRNPELGDSETVDGRIIFRKTMGGDLHTNVSVGTSKRMIIAFRILNSVMREALISFIKQVRHEQFIYTDHNSVAHTVKFPMSNFALSGGSLSTDIIRMELEVLDA